MYKTAIELFRSEYVSYSRLRSYNKCPQEFKLRYLDSIPCPSGRAAQLGSVVHSIIANYLQNVQSSKSLVQTDSCDLCEAIVPICKELREAGELTYFLPESEIETLLNGFAKLLPKIDSQSIVSIEAEKNFEISQYRFKAIIDLILCNAKDELTIIDFKTGKPEYVDDLQIQTYAIPLFRDTPVPKIELIYAFLKSRELSKSIMTRKSVTVLGNELVNRVQCIENDKIFSPKLSYLCSFCGVRDHCPKG